MCEIKMPYNCRKCTIDNSGRQRIMVSVETKQPNVLVLNNMDKKIVIIGAGAAGFAAASKLISAGFKNVLILEAENRIGGRIYTIPYGKNILEMGAQW